MDGKPKLNILSMAQIAVCSALLCVSAFIVVPVPIISVPFTLQVLVVVMTALILKPSEALTAQFIYTLLGVIGLPVFSGGQGGIGVIFSPTGGFIIGFIFASFIISFIKGKNENILRYIIVTTLVGIPIIYSFGVGFYMMFTGADVFTAIASVASVFIAVDIIKCVAASFIAIAVRKALKRANTGYN